MKSKIMLLAAACCAAGCVAGSGSRPDAGNCVDKEPAPQAIRRLLPEAPGEVAVVLTRLSSGERLYSSNSQVQMPSASTIKVLILAEIMRQVEAGNLSLEQRVPVPQEAKLADSIIGCLEQDNYTLRDLATMMIIESDNTATNVLIDLVGMDSVNKLGSELGLKATSLQRKMLDWEAVKAGKQNYTSANDLDQLMVAIGERRLISRNASEEMIRMLNMQKDIESFKRYMPEDLVVAHKSGSLDCLEHETGIFWVEGNDYVLTVMTRNCTSNADARDFIGKLSLAVFKAMGGKF
ncbi:MAG: serine hydrolase [Victivallaceae bacterium]|nr:serine hydrolase [Victivallaceae bacterium]